MKKLFNIIFTVIATAAVLSCGPDVEIPDEPNNQNQPVDNPPEQPVDPGFGGDVVFTATIESLSDGTQPAWKKGDAISVFDGTSTVKATNTADDGVVGKFPATIKLGTESVFALYPANDGVQLNATGVLLDIPVEQSIGTPVPSYKVAKGKSDVLYFRNLLAVLNLSVAFDGVTSVVIKADDAAKIAGTMTVDYSGESPVVAASSSQIEIKGSFQKDVVYPVVLAPAKLTECSVEAYVEDKIVAKTDLSGEELKPGTVLDMSSMESANPVYKITHLWLWGGTGPEWNGSRVFDLFTVENYFNNEDGRGVGALKDNYLVFNSDGTFCNWAGVDGRNWWHVGNSTLNPAKIDIDLKGFYELLPRATGTYVIEDNVVTFTREDATTVKADWVSAGDYKMPVPETNEKGEPLTPRIITITTEALRFDIKGGNDDWANIYSDYDVIAARPRVLFVELEKMPDGFTVPTESCTTDANYEFVPPVYEFDYTKLTGTWNVYGGNKAPYGFWVNGGFGSDPDFVSPIDKNWCWNDSVYNESDNTLTIALTGQTATGITGTIEWGAGEDGKYWDCIWNRLRGVASDEFFGQDLSSYFSPIPKGTSDVSVNLSTGVGKIGTDIEFTFISSGVHSFTCGKTLAIPSGCFALAFHIQDKKQAPEGYQYLDVDRFVKCPLDYVIIFEKE